MRMFFAAVSMGLAPLLIAAILASPVGAQVQGAGPKFKEKVALPSEGNTPYELIVSEDKKSALILFSGLETEWEGRGAPLFATRIFSISMPLAGAEKGVKLEVFLEGAVAHDKGTDVSLITSVNGRAHVMDFAKFSAPSSGESISEGCDKSGSTEERDAIKRKFGAKYSDRPRKPDVASKLSPNPQAGREIDASFVQCILLDAPSASALRMNVIFALHRHNPETQGYVNVSTMGAIVRSEAKRAK